MEFPPEWNVVSAEQFATAQPRAAGILGMELLVQARPNGRMLDHFRMSLGGQPDPGCELPACQPGQHTKGQDVAR
jgi:hypothetical protein